MGMGGIFLTPDFRGCAGSNEHQIWVPQALTVGIKADSQDIILFCLCQKNFWCGLIVLAAIAKTCVTAFRKPVGHSLNNSPSVQTQVFDCSLENCCMFFGWIPLNFFTSVSSSVFKTYGLVRCRSRSVFHSPMESLRFRKGVEADHILITLQQTVSSWRKVRAGIEKT